MDPDPTVERSERHGPMARQHVVLVNGSAVFLGLLRDLLQDERYTVTTTTFVPRTFDQIDALQPSLLVIDLVIGEQAGWELLAELRREATTRAIPVVVISTSARLLDAARANHAVWGGDRYLVMPFDLDDLLRGIDELIGPA